MLRIVTGRKRKLSLELSQTQRGRRRLTLHGSPVQAVILQDQLLPVPRNGHIIKLLDAGGAFCQRCGKSTARMKHLKLKILSKACKFQRLPPEK